MNSPQFKFILLAVLIFLFAYVAFALTQESTKTTEQTGPAEHQVTVQRGEVVYVSGNDLVVKDADTGELKAFVVPDTARATVNGQEMSVHDLKPGMTLERTITSISTPKVVTQVKTVQGKIWHVNPPKHVILSLASGENKEYTIPDNQKFQVNGQEVDAFHLKKGMNVTATVITEVPTTEVAEHRAVTGTPPMQGALLIEEAPAQQAAAPPPPPAMAKSAVETAENKPQLPQTGGALPLIALCGLLLAGVGFAALKLS